MNKNNSARQQGGFIQFIFLIIIVLIILYYLNIPLQKILGTQTAANIAGLIKNLVIIIWQDVLVIIQFVKGVISGK